MRPSRNAAHRAGNIVLGLESAEALTQQHDLLTHVQVGIPEELTLNELLSNDSSVFARAPRQQTCANLKKSGSVDALEEETRLSECMLWQLQEAYYRNEGANAWQDAVPNFVTSSTYIADAYAELVLAFIDDYYSQLDLNEPLYILEMATGTGRFSHLMLRELQAKLACFARYRHLKVKYIMSDFTDAMAAHWDQHEKLKPFVESGFLDFAVFNPLKESELTLRVEGTALKPGTVKNPIIAIANYFFDSIPQDVFRVEAKTLKEGLVTLHRNTDGLSLDAPVHINQLTPKFRYQALRNQHYYPNERWNEVLNQYRHSIRNGAILFPTGAFEVVCNLEKLSSNRLMLLSSDKSYTCPQEMIRYPQHEYAVHDGAFSYMVNYDALGRYFKNGNGHYLFTTGKSLSIQTICCVSLPDPLHGPERLRYLYEQKLNRANQPNTVFQVMPGRAVNTVSKKIVQLLAHIRLNLCEPEIICRVAEELAPLLVDALPTHREDLVAMMKQAWEQYFFMPGEVNLPYWLAQLYYGLGLYEKSNEFLAHAEALFGEHEVLHFLTAMNHEKLNHWQQAQTSYETALALNADFPEALEGLLRVESVLKARA